MCTHTAHISCAHILGTHCAQTSGGIKVTSYIWTTSRMASVYNMFLYFLWFEIGIGNHYEVTIINKFYSIWDTHSSINELLTLLCENKFSFNIYGNTSQLIDHYQQYIKWHTNEHHYIYNIR